jgi:hypothetical protein
MANPSPVMTKEFLKTRLTREDGKEPLSSKTTQVRLSPELTTALDALPNRSLWLRRVITEAAQREGLLKGDAS